MARRAEGKGGGSHDTGTTQEDEGGPQPLRAENWVYGPCNWGWKRAIQLAEEYYREADPGLRGSILQLRYMERRRREEVMDKLNISYSTYQKAHDDLLSTIAVFAAHYGEL